MEEKTRTRAGGPDDPREDLEAVVALRRTLEALEAAQVENAFVAGWSWAQIAEVLNSIGISLEDIRREAGEAFDMSLPDDRKIPYSPRAKNALVRARREMRMLGDNHLGTEHVLLGILGNEDGTAVRMLGRMGVSSGELEERLFELRGREAG